MQHLGLTYPEATRSLSNGDLGVITSEYTRALGAAQANLGVITSEFTRTLGIGATDPEKSSAWIWFWTVASAAGMGTGAYHGYKRNDSVGWAIGWALLGGIFPVVTIPVSIAQGFGQRKKG